ncbi:unnamed protein product [Caenorhabditis bovis]|uniref:Protein kinase domain-containing protein n=1 Tax=Caenorhabditis bovis TaxID=2654633 RepID=A0A8S1FFB4_9PELO|nr:unnamed protein product [Caenorhabditis bovis]
MTILHAGYPPSPNGAFSHHQVAPMGVTNKTTNSAFGHQHHHPLDGNDMVGGGELIRGNMLTRRDSDLSSNGSFENMSRPTYTGRDTERFFGGEFEMDDDDDHLNDEFVEDEDEPVSELVPLGGGTRRVPRTPKRKNVPKCGFFDFYKLTNEHLGSGAYGSVTTCTNNATNVEYAVKIIDKDGETHSRKRILREVNIFNTCKNHPNIVQLVDWFEDDSNFYLVMEKMRGGPLLQHILQRGYFTEEEARRVTKDIASALKFMHDRGIAHRDVKPENVLCTDPDHVSPVKLCDLDLASQRRIDDRHDRPLSQVASEPDLASPVGSAEFMAPEVVDAFSSDNCLKYDKKCDTWSLGVILYIMLAGYAPFQGECDDENCGWSDGSPCDDCQQVLFQRIQAGHYTFPEEEWDMISDEAKDLVSNLLKRCPTERYSADQILAHPWIQQQSAPSTILQTPSNLINRKDSARDVQQMSEHFNMINRARLSARMDQLKINENAEFDGSQLFVGGEPFGSGFARKLSSATNIVKASPTGEFTPPISRASPTTPPTSMLDLSDKMNDSGSYSIFSPQSKPTHLPPIYFGRASTQQPPLQLFGGGNIVLNSVQMTPRQTTEDDTVGSFGSSSIPSKSSSIGEPTATPANITGAQPIHRVGTQA